MYVQHFWWLEARLFLANTGALIRQLPTRGVWRVASENDSPGTRLKRTNPHKRIRSVGRLADTGVLMFVSHDAPVELDCEEWRGERCGRAAHVMVSTPAPIN